LLLEIESSNFYLNLIINFKLELEKEKSEM